MTTLSRNTVTLGLACCVSLCYASSAFADDPPAAASTSAQTEVTTTALPPLNKPAVKISDVALGEEGVVVGRVLNRDGKPLDGAQVAIRQGDEILHKLISDKEGQFSAAGLRPGVYTIATVHGSGLYRLWPKDIAPPHAQTQVLMMTQKPVMRAQFGGSGLVDWASLGVSTAGLVVGILALDKIEDVENDVKWLKKEIKSYQSP